MSRGVQSGGTLDAVDLMTLPGARSSILLTSLNTEGLRDLLHSAALARFAPHDTISARPAPDDALHVLVRGSAMQQSWTSRGRDEYYARPIGPGEVIGLTNALSVDPVQREARALVPAMTVRIPGTAVRSLVRSSPLVAAALLDVAARAVSASEADQVILATGDAMARVTHRLLELVAGWGCSGERGVDVDLPMTQAQLGAWAGVSRETTVKCLQWLRARNVVHTSRRHFAVLDLPELERLAGRREAGDTGSPSTPLASPSAVLATGQVAPGPWRYVHGTHDARVSMAGQDPDRGTTDGIAVLLVDDHPVLRTGLRLVLSACTQPAHRLTEAASVADARSRLATTTFDVALLDVMLPDGDGIQFCREIRRDHPSTACVILTSHSDRHLLIAASLAGASTYLLKSATTEEVCRAIRSAARGERTLDDDVMAGALESVAQDHVDDDVLSALTEQERRVFLLLGQGLSNLQMAERMHLTEKTVKNYVSRMLTKLCMDRRTEAAVLAARLGERRNRDRGQPGNYSQAG